MRMTSLPSCYDHAGYTPSAHTLRAICIRYSGEGQYATFLLQLMFSNPMDPPSVTAARNLERQHMHRWVEEAVYADRLQLEQ